MIALCLSPISLTGSSSLRNFWPVNERGQFPTYKYFSSGDKAIPFGPVKSFGDQLEFALVDGVNTAEWKLLARIVEEFWKTERRIGKEQRAIGSVIEIIWAIQPLALVTVRQHGLRPVVFVAHDAMIAVLIDRQPTLRIEG